MQLMHVMFGFFQTLAHQDTLALLVDLEHMELSLFARPAEHFLENVGDVIHEIDRVIPAHDKETGLELRFLLVGLLLDSSRQQFRRSCFRHMRTLKDSLRIVERTGTEKTSRAKKSVGRESPIAPRGQIGQSHAVVKGVPGSWAEKC